jgi:hypothetical protein
MECAHYSLEVVRDAIPRMLKEEWDERCPERYLEIVGIICVYARPFTRSDPVGKLSEQIVPEEFRQLHDHILTLRHKLFAHADASLTVGKDDYPNEVVIEHDGRIPAVCITRASAKKSLLEQMVPLVGALIEKTDYHRSRLGKKYAKAISNLVKGEFRFNVADPEAPIFIPLSEEEKRVREKRKNAFDFNTIL